MIELVGEDLQAMILTAEKAFKSSFFARARMQAVGTPAISEALAGVDDAIDAVSAKYREGIDAGDQAAFELKLGIRKMPQQLTALQLNETEVYLAEAKESWDQLLTQLEAINAKIIKGQQTLMKESTEHRKPIFPEESVPAIIVAALVSVFLHAILLTLWSK